MLVMDEKFNKKYKIIYKDLIKKISDTSKY